MAVWVRVKSNMWYSLIKPLLFRLEAEKAHHFTFQVLQNPLVQHGLTWLSRPLVDRPVTVGNLQFKNPIGLAAGLDKNGDYLNLLAQLGFGFIEVGTVTPKPQVGNPKPRLFRIPQAEALINRMGFNNQGVKYLVEKLKNRPANVIVGANIGKNKDTPLEQAARDYCYCLTEVYPFVDYVTINLSSPNTPGLRQLQSEIYLRQLLTEIMDVQKELKLKYCKQVPLWIKIAPDLTLDELEIMVNLFLTFEVDGVIATNTTIDHEVVKNLRFGKEEGGLSGRPLFPKSTKIVAELSQMVQGKIPIIAVGGIMSGEDALIKLKSGANLIQLYSGLIYRGPGLIREILNILNKLS